MKPTLMAIDLAMNAFQVYAANEAGKIRLNEATGRPTLIEVLSLFGPTTLAMEACAGGSTPITRTLQKSPIMGQKECFNVEKKEVQSGVQAGCC